MLGGGHQRGILRRVLPALGRSVERSGIGPETRQGGGRAAVGPQQSQRVGEIGIEQAVVAHHGLHPGVARENGTLLAEHPPARNRLLGQHQRAAGAQQGESRLLAQVHPRRHGRRGEWPVLQYPEQAALHPGAQDLRIGKAGEQIEGALGAAAGDPADHRQARGPVLEAGVGKQPVAALCITDPEGIPNPHDQDASHPICLNDWTDTRVRSMIIADRGEEDG